MDGFSYIDIFETKGIEYILIIVFLLLIIPFWYLLSRKKQISAVEKPASFSLLNLSIPMGIFFSSNHTWAYLERSGLVRTGIDDFLFRVAGKLQLNLLRKEGENIKKGDLIAEALKNGRKLKIYSPVSGVISSVNRPGNDGFLSEDPYGEGWLFKLIPSYWKAESRSYLLADEARVWLGHELERFRDMIAEYASGNGKPVLQDGGEISGHPLLDMPEGAWKEFEKSFLTLEVVQD